MANIVARILEKRIGKLFSNFHAGKNASSSLLKGEGTANDLEFNKAFINSFLPLSISVTRATCKLLKWRLSLVSKTPVSLVFTGVHIEVQALPQGQERSAWTKKRKKRSRKDSESKSKKQAILQGIKLQLHDVNLKVIMLPEHGAGSLPAGGAQEHPYLQLDIAQVRVHSANSQWHEVSDLSKVYVINPAVGEAMSFKKLEMSGCFLCVYHPAAHLTARKGLSASASKQPVVLWDNVAVQAKLSTKRRCTSWEVLSFKLDIEMPQLSCALSRLEVSASCVLSRVSRSAAPKLGQAALSETKPHSPELNHTLPNETITLPRGLLALAVSSSRTLQPQVPDPKASILPPNLNPTPYTLHPTPYALYPKRTQPREPPAATPTPNTLHSTPYTLRPAPCTLHPAPYTLHPTP